jgi:uncharacterized protein
VSALYVDTSALGRVLFNEPDKPAIEHELSQYDTRWSSQLLYVELRRFALRHGLLDPALRLLRGLALITLAEATLRSAATIEPTNVATLDAIHLATAVRLHADGELDAILTYDARLSDGARHHGIAVLAPT